MKKKKVKNVEKIMNEITTFCNDSCSSKNCCPEDECVLYRIEKIVDAIPIIKCECCWEVVDGELFELDGLTMCKKCFEYHGGEKNGQ